MRGRSPGRRCAVCGEPVAEHGRRELTTFERLMVVRDATTRQDANSRLRAAMRVCPVVAVKTPAGKPQRWRPRRLKGRRS